MGKSDYRKGQTTKSVVSPFLLTLLRKLETLCCRTQQPAIFFLYFFLIGPNWRGDKTISTACLPGISPFKPVFTFRTQELFDLSYDVIAKLDNIDK